MSTSGQNNSKLQLKWQCDSGSAASRSGAKQILPFDEITIGRDAKNIIVLDDNLVSRFHAQLLVRPTTIQVTDLGSGNGTTIEGKRITSALWQAGETLQIGNSRFTFETIESAVDEPNGLNASRFSMIWRQGAGSEALNTSRIFSVGTTLTVGRGDDQDIRLDDSSVSRGHARLDLRPDGVVVTDLESGNGTRIDGKRITSTLWRPGQVLQIGKHTFELAAEAEREQFGQAFPRPSNTRIPAPSRTSLFRLNWQHSGGKRRSGVFPHGSTLTVGRGDDQDIRLDDSSVSRGHARLDLRPDGVVVTDLESGNGTRIDGKRITSTLWRPGQVLQIGKHTFELAAEAEREQFGQAFPRPSNTRIPAPSRTSLFSLTPRAFNTLWSAFSIRANVFLVLFGALLAIGGIKLTSLLPAKYYFSFSKMVAGVEGPFIVDPPSVSGRKMCAMLQKYGISDTQIGNSSVNCRIAHEDDKQSPALTASQKDALYTLILQADPPTRAYLQKQFPQNYKLDEPKTADIDRLISDGVTIGGVYEQAAHYFRLLINSAVSREVGASFDEKMNQKFGPIQEISAGERADLKPLSDNENQRIRRALTDFRSRFLLQLAASPIEPYTKTNIDAVLEKAQGRRVQGYEIASYYAKQTEQLVNTQMAEAFARQDLPVVTKSEARKTLFAEMSRQGLGDYIVSVTLRLAPVALLAFVGGILLGRVEINSIGFAGGLAALLLTWPTMYAWDQLVSYNWQQYRPLFTTFYIVYIFAFYLVARVAAIIGVYIGQERHRHDARGAALSYGPIGGWEVVANLVLGLVVNALVYGFNVAIPLLLSPS